MATWIAQRSGDWSVPSGTSTSPWYDASTQSALNTYPVAGDTVTIPPGSSAPGYTVTVTGSDAACATLNLTYVASPARHGYLVIGNGSEVRTLTLTGNLSVDGDPETISPVSNKITLNAGCNLLFNPGTGNTATLQLGTATGSLPSARMICNGTSTSRCRVGMAAGGAGTVLMRGYGTNAQLNFLIATYTDFVGLGTATLSTGDAISVSMRTGFTCEFNVSNCTFQNCGRVLLYMYGGTNSFSITNCVWSGSLCTSASGGNYGSLCIQPTALNTTGTRILTGNSFDQHVVFGTTDWTTTNNVFAGSIGLLSTTSQWTGFNDNFIQVTGSTPMPLNVSNCYFYNGSASTANNHFLQGPCTSTLETISNCIFEGATGADGTTVIDHDNGDCIDFYSYNPSSVAVKNCIELPTPAGYMTGNLGCSEGAPSGGITIEHCTIFDGNPSGWGAGEASYVGESTTPVAGMYNSYRSNICWANVSPASGGYKFTDLISSGVAICAGSAMDYNAGWNQVTGTNGKGYTDLTFSSGTPGAHDPTDQNPNFVDPTRNLATWAVTQGSVASTYLGRVANAISYLTTNPSLIAGSLIPYIQAGFVIQNSALNFSYTGDTNAVTNLGAGQGSFGNTATISGPSSGSVLVDSTAFTVTLSAAAPSGGTIVSLASTGSGDVFQATSGGSSVTSITIAQGQTTGTFYLVPGTTGSRTITPTATGITFTPTTESYSAIDTTPPVVLSANVNAAGTTLTIVFTEVSSPPVLPSSGVTGLTLSASGGSVTLSSSAISGTTYTATTSRTIYSNETLTLSYTPGNITDSATSPNAMTSFSGTTVTNNSTQVASSLTAGTTTFVSSGPITTGISVLATAATNGSGSGPTYQWQRNTNGGTYSNLSGATSLSLTDTTAVAGNLYGYQCVQTRGSSNVTTNAVTAQIYNGGPLSSGAVGSIIGCSFIRGI